MYDVIRVTLDWYKDSMDIYHPLATARGLSKKARNNSTRWHKSEYVEVGVVDQEADDWYEILTGHAFTSTQDNNETEPPKVRYFSISNYRREGLLNNLNLDNDKYVVNEMTPKMQTNSQSYKRKNYRTLLIVWEVEPGVGTVSGPVYISGGRAKKLIKMLTGHQYKMHNTD